MMKTKNAAPSAGAKGFLMAVMPDKENLESAIADNGNCHPKKCWHRVGILAVLLRWDPKLNPTHAVRVDAGHVKIQYKGWNYTADTPRHVKRSLMLFDRKFYNELRVREYNLRFRRTTKIRIKTKAEKETTAEAQRIRRAEGRYPDYRPARANLRKRVEGFSSIV